MVQRIYLSDPHLKSKLPLRANSVFIKTKPDKIKLFIISNKAYFCGTLNQF